MTSTDNSLINVPLVDKKSSLQQSTYGYPTLLFLCLNFNIGVLLVILPRAVAHAGWLLSSVFIILVTLVCILSLYFLCESMTRAIAIKRFFRHESGELTYFDLPKAHLYMTKSLQINETLEILFSTKAKVIYQWLFFIFEVAVLWNFTSVFSVSFTHLIDLPFFAHSLCDANGKGYSDSCLSQYFFWLVCFSVVAVTMSLKNLEEQAFVQYFLTFFRGIVVVIIIVTCVIAMVTGKFSSHKITDVTPVPMFDSSGFGMLFGTVILSQVIHHGVPSLSSPCRKKQHIARVLSFALVITCTLYIVVSIIATRVFGQEIRTIMSLEWIRYTGGYDNPPTWALILSYTVACFPPVDIISAFPLGAVTLANTLLAGYGDENKKKHIVISRLVASLPPLLLAATRLPVALISEIGGLFGFFICFCIPPLAVLKSRKLCKQMAIGQEYSTTDYDLLRHPVFPYTVMVFGIFGFFLSIFMLFK
ncbi:hypothetical protein P9112_014039 [Eukaryota sp. TZLM1-RC]